MLLLEPVLSAEQGDKTVWGDALTVEHKELLRGSLSVFEEHNDYSGRIVLKVEPGHGETLGQFVRHALLTAVPGFGITDLKITFKERSQGGRSGIVPHLYTRIPGVVEDVRQVVINLRNVTLRLVKKQRLTHTVRLQGPTRVTAKDMFDHPQIELATPDAHIAMLSGPVDITCELNVAKGTGFGRPSALPTQDIFLLGVDPDFQPVRRVGLAVSKLAGWDQVEWLIETRGDATPIEAWKEAVKQVSRKGQ